jgi:para-nitrobenzyl esterase
MAAAFVSPIRGDEVARGDEVKTPPTDGVVITTNSGRLEGAQRGDVQVFLGVPYAKAPVGPLRWRPPQRLPAWRGIRQADRFGPSCYQEWPAKNFGPYTAEFVDTPKHAEDCLYLNVWRPSAGSSGRPLFFWIHGGGFGGGSGAVEIYDGAQLARRGIVVVSINYRVGPFGFLAQRELTRESGSSGNYGLEDMVAALRWVHANARALGADPQRITIAGQSAGAIAVDDLLAAPQARGLFSAAIAQSGSGLGIDAIPIREAEANGAKFAARLGVTTLAQLRALSPEAIQAGIPSYFGPPSTRVERIPFRPVLDGKLLAADPADGAVRPASAVPLMTGFNADEFMAPATVTPQEFEANARTRFGVHADEFIALYPHATDGESTVSSRLLSRDTYMASLWTWVDRRARLNVAPLYAYFYDHPAPAPMDSGAGWGTFHTSEVPYVFGNLNRERRAYADADMRVSEQLQARWLSFLRTRDPNQDGLPEWKRAEPGVQAVMALGDRAAPIAPVSTPERMAAFQRFVAAGGRLSVL